MHGVKEQIEKFRRQLRAVRFIHDVDFQGMVLGQPAAFIGFYRRLLCEYSTDLTKHLVDKGFALLGLTDYRFMEVIYRIMRDLLNIRAPITLSQFYSSGFTERKLDMATMLTERFCSLLPARPSFRRGPQRRSVSSISHPNPVNPAQSLTARSHIQRLPKCHSIPEILPDVLLRASKPAPPTDPNHDDVDSKSSDGIGRIVDARQPQPIERKSRTCSQYLRNENEADSEIPLDTRVWAEESHNQMARLDSWENARNRIVNQQQNQCSTFSSTIPSVGQMNQSQLMQFETYGQCKPYVKSGNSYRLLNSNPRPCSYSTLSNMTQKTGKPPPSCASRSPSSRNTLPVSTLTRKPLSRGSVTSRRWPAEEEEEQQQQEEPSQQPGSRTPERQQRPMEDNPPRDSMQEILCSLSQLTTKVDTMLTRLTTLELRLPRVNRDPNDEDFCESPVKPPSPDKRSCSPRDRYSVGNGRTLLQSETAQASESSRAPVRGPSILPCPTTLVESTLQYPTPELTTLSSTSSSTTNTTDHLHPAVPFTASNKIPDRQQLDRMGDAIKHRVFAKPTPQVTPNQPVKDAVQSSRTDRFSSQQKALAQPFGENRRHTSFATASGIEDNVQSSTGVLPPTIPANSVQNLPVGNDEKQPLYRFPNRITPPNPPVPNRPPGFSGFRFDPYLGRFKKPVLFRRTDSFEYSANNSLDSRPPSSEPATACKESNAAVEQGPRVCDTYHAQVDRITSMLAETQGLLETQRPKMVDGTA